MTPIPMRTYAPSRPPGPVSRLRGRLVKVGLVSGAQVLGRLEETSKFELVMLAPNGRRVTIFKHAVSTLEDLPEAKP